MNHPTPEDWMAHLYGETAAPRRAELDAHLRQCAACAAQVQSWRASQGALDAWKLPQPRVARRPGPGLAWAAAAAIVLLAGFALGRFSAGDARAVQAALQQEFGARLAVAREELRQEAAADVQRVLAGFARDLDEQRGADTESLLTALRQVDARHAANFSRLRRDLDTVAVVADGRLSDTQEQLLQLVSANRPTGLPQPGTE